jgi:hypothetical protein
VTLSVTPLAGAQLPPDGTLVVDVEAFADGRPIGGFRKIFRPPVSVHRPKDPVYAESEIFVDPYPAIAGVPTTLGVEVFNPTPVDRIVKATFSIAPFGIGLPFSTAHIAPNPIHIFVPRHGAARGHTIWRPPDFAGKFCVRVTLEMESYEPVWSQRNIDVGEPLRPGAPHNLIFPVDASGYTKPMTITLGLRTLRAGFDAVLSPTKLVNVQPGQQVPVTLAVTPKLGTPLGTGLPIVDVEAYVDGELIGGFRKMDVPPVSVHKPHEKKYAESEIRINPDPPQVGKDTQVSAVIHNTGTDPVTVIVEFGWAKFGMGIPFSTAGMTPHKRTVTVNPGTLETVTVTWRPTKSGHQCIRVFLNDAEGLYERQESMRNVDVEQRPDCGQTHTYYLTIYNDSPNTEVVDTGLMTFDVPSDWVVTVHPKKLTIGPYQEGLVTINVFIPCALTLQAQHAAQEVFAMQQRVGGVPIIDVEGYIDGELLGGVELRFPDVVIESKQLYLPVITKR